MEDSPPEFIRFRKAAPPRPRPYDLALDLVVQVQSLLDVAPIRFRVKDELDRSTTAIAMSLAHVLEVPTSTRWHNYRSSLRLASTCETLLDIIARQGVVSEHLDKARTIIAQLRHELSTLSLYKL